MLAGKIEVTKFIEGIERNIGWRAPGKLFGEIPIIFVDRRVGISKMDSHIVLEAIATPWRLWLTWLFHRPRARR